MKILGGELAYDLGENHASYYSTDISSNTGKRMQIAYLLGFYIIPLLLSLLNYFLTYQRMMSLGRTILLIPTGFGHMMQTGTLQEKYLPLAERSIKVA